MSNNTVMISGRLGQDPLSKKLSSGKKVAEFSLAVRDFNGTTMWFPIECWNGLGERALEYLKQGREVIVTGRMIIQQYTVPGSQTKRTRVKVVASSFHFCGGKGKSGNTTAAADASPSVDDDSEDFEIIENDTPSVAEPSPPELHNEDRQAG